MGSSLRLKKFKWNRPGYAEVMNAPGVQSVLKGKADAVRSSADAGLKKSSGHYVKQFDGILSKGYVVGAQKFEARYAQSKHKNLSKALGSAKGDG